MNIYTARDLIDAYVRVVALQTHTIHPALETAYRARFAALSRCFGIHLEEGEYDQFPDRALKTFNAYPPDDALAEMRGQTTKAQCWRLFQETIQSLLAIRTPFSSILAMDGHLLHVYAGRFTGLEREYREAHWALLTDLFRLMYDEINQMVTSDDLRVAGFDDTNLPDERAYL